ncbi:porin [Janthinobacterium sp. HLX7-2]|uniref:porin n=1 Tax=Janthinobacterium sp. HLX7-2 TaxID=1259331 RepID=UPI003F24FA83
MKRTTISIACALCSTFCASSAIAQSQVTIYGLVDTGLVWTNNANSNGDSVIKMPSLTGTFPSRLGFRGAEDLGGGTQAIFALETGFAPDTGVMGTGNRLFGRQSYVGLKNATYGTLTLGRQVNMTLVAMLKSDVLGPNLFSISGLDLYIPNARSDNSIAYLGSFNNFSVGATYSFGRDTSAAGGPAATGCAGEVAGNAKACRQWTALLGYDNKSFGVTASYDIMYGNVGAAGGLTTSDSSDRRATLNGYALVGPVKIGGGVLDRKKQAATAANSVESDLYYLGASYPIAPTLDIDAQVARLDIKNSRDDTTFAAVRLTHYLSKRTAVYGMLGYMKNSGNAAVALDAGGTVGVGKNQSGVMTGLRHTF